MEDNTIAALILNQYRKGSSYKDEIGQVYHFPKRYLGQFSLLPAKFIYYEPREGGAQEYYGGGLVAAIYDDTEEDGHFYADLYNYGEFSKPVSFYGGPHGTWEPSTRMRNSVRQIQATLYDELYERGGATLPVGTATAITRLDRIESEFNEIYHQKTPTMYAPKLRRIQRLLELYERPGRITNYVKSSRGDRCQLCGISGFLMRNGKRYCEIHHLFHLCDDPPPECLAQEYIIVLCATCHRRMHYSVVGEPQRHQDGWLVSIDGRDHYFETFSATAAMQ